MTHIIMPGNGRPEPPRRGVSPEARNKLLLWVIALITGDAPQLNFDDRPLPDTVLEACENMTRAIRETPHMHTYLRMQGEKLARERSHDARQQ